MSGEPQVNLSTFQVGVRWNDKWHTRLTSVSFYVQSSIILLTFVVPIGSPSPDGDVAVYSVLVSDSFFMALSTLFYSINSPHNSPLSYSVVLVVFVLSTIFFFFFMKIFLSPGIILCG